MNLLGSEVNIQNYKDLATVIIKLQELKMLKNKIIKINPSETVRITVPTALLHRSITLQRKTP
jgi:hypothetical protein